MITESYRINGRQYGINESFELFLDGNRIGEATDIDVARKFLFDYAESQVRAEYNVFQERMAEAQRTLQKIGSDPRNLVLFLERRVTPAVCGPHSRQRSNVDD